ncbi:MAG TPA: protein kinase [Pyrinomonadaceae bacterium]|jgi:serine/threonine protein kinase|nr:protein kinase [Pyrinomonadaceae bacterium]
MEPGKKVGSYVLEEPVGRGGMGVVYRGRHEKLQRAVAVKSINPKGTHDLRRLRHRFEREAFVQAQLDHPGIVKIYDYIVSEQSYFIVMEYVEGRSLAQLIKENAGGIESERALDIFEQILSAVSYAHTFTYRDEAGATHQGIVHRDLKPPNIMVTDGDRIKVTDFGIVKLVGAEATDTSKIAYGSPRYVSPEQAAGEQLDQRSDIYSLGVILYEMLTGRPPFGPRDAPEEEKLTPTEILRAHREQTPAPPAQLNPSVTPPVEAVVLRALEKKPERRFATAEDFLRALRKARGRAPEPEQAAAGARVTARADAAKGTGQLGETTDELSGDPYHTQPITHEPCPSCGESAGSEDGNCRACGHDMSASPATAELIRRDATTRQGGRGLRLLAVAVALFVLLASLVYLAGRSLKPTADEGEASANATPESSPSPAPTQAIPADASKPLEARVKVDSSFDSYNERPLTDGVWDVREIRGMRYNQGNWVSAESPVPHWVELDLGRASRVTAVYVYWGFDKERYMPSRRVELQSRDGGGEWRTVSTLEAGDNFDRAAFEFEPFEAKALRVFQPAQSGPANRPFVMWLREVQVFGAR